MKENRFAQKFGADFAKFVPKTDTNSAEQYSECQFHADSHIPHTTACHCHSL
jgi:hypothetical protein